jgi:hypothetical protein
MRANFGCIAVLIFALSLTAKSDLANAAEDSFLFERGNFRIHYVSNGGNCAGCDWISIDGEIPEDAGDDLQAFVVRNKFDGVGYNVVFNSGGGSLIGAIRLGRTIRKLKFDTSVGQTVPEGQWHGIRKGICYSACAYAFLGGVRRAVESGEYGVHQFYSSALLKNPDGKVFTPIDFSIQQATTGLLLSYVLGMGASAGLVVEANKTLPTDMNIISKQRLTDFGVSFDPEHYEPWKIEAYRNGIVTFSRSQDEKRQMTVYCAGSRATILLVTYSDREQSVVKARSEVLNQIQKFALLGRPILRAAIKIEKTDTTLQLRIPLSVSDIQALESDNDPDGAFVVHEDEPRAHYGAVNENLNPDGLAANLRLAQRNCINS